MLFSLFSPSPSLPLTYVLLSLSLSSSPTLHSLLPFSNLSVLVHEETPSTGSFSVRAIRQKSVGVGCPQLTLSSQHLQALAA